MSISSDVNSKEKKNRNFCVECAQLLQTNDYERRCGIVKGYIYVYIYKFKRASKENIRKEIWKDSVVEQSKLKKKEKKKITYSDIITVLVLQNHSKVVDRNQNDANAF